MKRSRMRQGNGNNQRGWKLAGWQMFTGWFLVFLALFFLGSHLQRSETVEEVWVNPYTDVPEDLWSYQYITELNKVGVLPSTPNFEPKQAENRGNLIQYLYNMDCNVFTEQRTLREEEREKQGAVAPVLEFTDVQPETPLYDAVAWGYEYQLISGKSDNTFAPDELLNREQVCAIIARFAALEDISLIQVVKPDQFVDSLYIHPYARSGVTACQLAAVVKGRTNGYFCPEDQISRQECAAMVYRMMMAGQAEPPEGVALVDLTPGAYDSLYNDYVDIPFEALVPTSQQPAPLDYFNQTVFIGDSVSLVLESYCASSQALGQAKFLCAGSMSATNMLSSTILPEWPKGSGNKPPIQESVAATGAKVVYVMLGMDNIAFGLERSTGDMMQILQMIQERNPDVTIIIQSVTPMAEESTTESEKLNNSTIDAYNKKMLDYCNENKWYFVNVSEAFRDENGYLRREYCSDYGKMGMHFTYEGAKVWVEYLKDHVPEDLLEDL